jgi:fatty-acyl-CoA synthase
MLKEYHRKGITLSQIFGQTEASTITSLSPEDAVPKIGSVGLPVLHGEVRIVDKTGKDASAGEVGEIMIKGPTLMSGYWNRPELTAETIRDGWLHTGDLAKKDEEGFIYIVDREKDMYISGGEEKTSIRLRLKRSFSPTQRSLMQLSLVFRMKSGAR